MLKLFYDMSMLAFEMQQDIWLRAIRLSLGGGRSMHLARPAINENFAAAVAGDESVAAKPAIDKAPVAAPMADETAAPTPEAGEAAAVAPAIDEKIVTRDTAAEAPSIDQTIIAGSASDEKVPAPAMTGELQLDPAPAPIAQDTRRQARSRARRATNR